MITIYTLKGKTESPIHDINQAIASELNGLSIPFRIFYLDYDDAYGSAVYKLGQFRYQTELDPLNRETTVLPILYDDSTNSVIQDFQYPSWDAIMNMSSILNSYGIT